MCRTCGRRHNSFDQEYETTSPGSFQDGNLESPGTSAPFLVRSPGKVSPLRGRTMKEYEEQLARLKKENFSLKLRIYFLEEGMGQKYDKENKDNIYQSNIELKVENEGLKKELYDKQELLRQASSMLSGLDQHHQDQLDQMKVKYEQDSHHLQDKIQQLQREVDDYANNFEGNKLGELTQLCSLAFSTGNVNDAENKVSVSTTMPSNTTGGGELTPSVMKGLSVTSPVTGLFSIPGETSPLQDKLDKSEVFDSGDIATTQEKITELETQISDLQTKVEDLEENLSAKQQISEALENDVFNLRRELEDREDKICDLEAEVAEKDQRVDQLMQELETRHTEIQDRESKIQLLHNEISRVEPQIEVKVQEIVERDRIIEEKIEQIQQQNKILVEIQITLDEKQKQITELEDKLTESQDKIKKLTEESHEKTLQLQTNVKEIESRDKEILTTKKEVKRLEKKCRDLVAELKEAIDMANKFMWEAETSGGEDGVKEMVEEENERLWAELEQRKAELLALKVEHETALQEAQKSKNALQEALDEANKHKNSLQQQCDENNNVIKEQDNKLKDKGEEIINLEKELANLRGDVNSREGLLRSNQGIVEGLKSELAEARDLLSSKRQELDLLQEELKKKNSDMQDLVNKELWERNKEVEKLQNKLTALHASHQEEIEAMKHHLQIGNLYKNPSASESGFQSEATFSKSYVLKNDQHPNVVNVTHLNNTCPTVQSASQQPVHVTLSSDNATVQFLYQEMSKIRCEAESLRQERLVLNSKLRGLQNLHKEVSQNSPHNVSGEIQQQIEHLRKQLEETKEESVQKDKNHTRIVTDFQDQIESLRSELSNAKKRITQQISEVSVRKYKENIKFYKNEVSSLRKRLADSHNACDHMRTRLEELVEFLERVLEMDKDGIINLSHFSAQERATLQQSLNESRALSQTLSQSLMIGMESMLGDSCPPDDLALSSSVSSASSFSMHRDDSLNEIPDYLGRESLSSLRHEPLPANAAANKSNCLDITSPDDEYQILAAKLSSEIDSKGKEIDGIAEKVSNLSNQLEDRVTEIQKQSNEIETLQKEVADLRQQLKLKEQQIERQNEQITQTIALQRDCKSSPLELFQNEIIGQLNRGVNIRGSEVQISKRESKPDISSPLNKNNGKQPIFGQLSVSSCSDGIQNHSLLRSDKPPGKIPTIVRTEQEIELSHHPSDNSSLNAMKSAYSTDIAIKAHSNNPDYFQKLTVPLDCLTEGKLNKVECVSASGALEQTPAWTLLSPSESEAWSEPDRNVSLARIGLDTSTLAASLDRSLSRSRQTRTSAALSSESEGEIVIEEGAAIPTNAAGNNKNCKRKSDAAEFRRLCAKLRNVEQLNETLKAELNIYQTISMQVPQSSPAENSAKSVTWPLMTDKSVETLQDDSSGTVAVNNMSMCPILPIPLLEEIRALRVKLEEAIANNDHLRDQLEAAIAVHPNEDPHINQLALTLQATTDQLQFAQEKITTAYKSEQSLSYQFNELQHKLKEKIQQHEELRAQYEIVNVEVIEIKSELKDCMRLLKEKESMLTERTEKLAVAEEYKVECEAKLSDQNKAITSLCENLTKLQKQTPMENLEEKNKRLQDALQATENKLLEVTKERLALITEKTRLQAQLSSVTTQAQLYKEGQDNDSDLEKEQGISLKYKKAQITIKKLEQEKQELLIEKHSNDKEREILKEEIADLRGRAEHMLVRESHLVHDQAKDLRDAASLRNVLSQMQQRFNNLQDMHAVLQCETGRYEEEVMKLKSENRELNSMLCRYKETESKLLQLTAQLDSERQLTSNLQLQLESLQALRHSSSPNSDTLQDASDITSPGSATSFEYLRPPAVDVRPTRPASLGSLKERHRSGSGRRMDYWSDNKENLLSSNTTLASGGSGNHHCRSRRSPSLTHDLVTSTADDGEAVTTSGESPDLGIGSDCHFSSLERGTRTLKTLVSQTQSSSARISSLCSEPSHSSLIADNEKLKKETENLNQRLTSTKSTLRDTLHQLSQANLRKENVEKAMKKQVIKTQDVLTKIKSNSRKNSTVARAQT